MLKDSNIVEKSKSLVWAKFKDYGAGELKILDTYLSRIDARRPESSMVTFTKKEYAELMGLDSEIKTSQLKNYTKGLLGNVVTLELPDGKEGYEQYSLFTVAKCGYDEELGQVVVRIKCNEELKSAFFGLAESGYVRYQLKNVIALKSQYSIRLYSILKDRPFGWTVSVDELRERLGATAATYQAFKDFNKMIIQRSVKEINDITDIMVTTEMVKKGRSVVAVKFHVYGSADPAEEEESVGIFDFSPIPVVGGNLAPNDPLGMVITVLPKSFTRDQAGELRNLAKKWIPYETANFGDKEEWISDYIQDKVRLMNVQDPPVKHPYRWLRKAVDEDWR